MLQAIRDKITGWVAIVFLGAIGIVFIFWGVDMGTSAGARYAAEVNGEGIPIDKVQRAWQQQEQQLQQMLRAPVPEEMALPQQQALIDQFIRNELLSQQAQELGYRIGDEALQQVLNGYSELQVDGKFSPERYEFLLAQQGRTIGEFERELRTGMQIEHLQRGIAATAFVTPSEMIRRVALQAEKREIDYAVIPIESFLTSVAIDDAQIQAYYDERSTEFMTAETVDLEYLELKLSDIESEVQVTDEALLAYYDQVKERFTEQERRRGRHILIAIDDTVDDAAAKATADEVLTKLNAGGDFAELAKQYSKDPVSAEKGGDLDWATRGMFVGPFEDALFAMNEGELRGPVKTEFGYHILRLDDIEGGQVKSFDEVRAELESDYRSDQAQKLFYDRSQKLADEAFAVLTELSSVSETLSLPLQKAPGFTRQGGEPLGADPKVIEAAFRPEAIDKRENSALITLADDHVLVLRVTAHRAPERLPLAAVRTQIESRLKVQAARDAAAKRGADLLARLDGGAPWSAVLTESKLATVGKRTVGRDEGSVPAPVRTAAFSVPRATIDPAKPIYRSATLEDGGHAIVAVTQVTPGVLELGTPDAAAQLRQAAQSQGEEEFAAYVSALERDAKISRNPRVFE